MPDNRPKRTFTLQQFLLALLLGAIGFAGNWFRFPLFFNVDLLFGSIFVMLALQFCGLLPALLAAVIAGSATLLIWNHPYALLIFTCELLITGLLYRRWRGNLMLANTAYWLVIGMPLAAVFYGLVMKVGSDGATAIMFKQAINGIANAIFARLVATSIPHNLSDRYFLKQPPSFRERITTLLAFFVMGTALILLALVSRRDVARTEQQIMGLLNATRSQAEQLLAAGHSSGTTTTKEHLLLQIQASNVLKRISYTLYDQAGNIIAANRQPAEPLPVSGGTINNVTELISCWVPDMYRNVSIMERWKRSVYLTKLNTPDGLLVIQTPVAPWLTLMYSNTVHILATSLALFLVALIPGAWISGRISQSLLQLGKTTTSLPSRIEAGEELEWPISSIPEVARLTNDLRTMTSALSQALNAEKSSLRLLQDESDKREQLEMMLREYRVEERLRISRELHDDIGQSLQAVKLNLQLQYTACNCKKCPGPQTIQELVHSIEQVTANLRSVVSSLRQTSDDGLTLPESLQTMGEKLCQYTSIQFKLQCHGLIEELPPELATTLFFICQEAVANAVRHGNPSEIAVLLNVASESVILSIIDNGSGTAALSPEGAGIAIMQERAALTGGTMQISSPEGTGTIITVEVPLP